MPARRTLKQLANHFINKIDEAGQYWLDRQAGKLGNYGGTVSVPDKNGVVYVRLQNGQVVQALNTIAPAIYNWPVYVGREKFQPHILKVIETRWAFNAQDMPNYLTFHHTQHEFPGPDTVFVYRDQFMPLLVYPYSGLTVKLFGDVIYTRGMTNPLRIPDTLINLTSYVPSSGAQYLLFEIETDGTFNYIASSVYASREILVTTAPMPTPSDNTFPVCVFVLWNGQTEVRRDSERRDIIDLRMFTSPSSDIHTHNLVDLDDVDPAALADDFILQWDSTASKFVLIDPSTLSTGSGGAQLQLVMESGVSNPPVPVETPDGTDWVYYEV